MTKGSGSVVLGLSFVLLVGLTAATGAKAESTPTDAAKGNPANSDGQLIALRPQYGNRKTGNRYTNGGGVKWGNHKTGNRTSGNKYMNGRHKYGNDVSGNRQWRDQAH